MDINKMHWTYGVLRTSGPLDVRFHTGPLPSQEIEEILGGPYELLELHDDKGSVLAARLDREEKELPPNPHYQNGIRGDVVLGKLDAQVFVGALGVIVP